MGRNGVGCGWVLDVEMLGRLFGLMGFSSWRRSKLEMAGRCLWLWLSTGASHRQAEGYPIIIEER